MNAGLRASGVRVRFGEVEVIRGVDVAVSPGRVTGLIGPNGAGKTTLVDALMGFVPLAAGDVVLDGHSMLDMAPHQRVAAGMTRTFQTVELFEDLTVGENIAVADEAGARRADPVADMRNVLALPAAPDEVAARLGAGQRKTLALARALACRPRVLLLDEPAAGLDRGERAQLAQAMRDIATAGTAVLVVDHDLRLILDVCDEVVVLDLGTVVFRGTPGELRADDRVAAAYLGERPSTPAGARREATVDGATQPAVSARGISLSYADVHVVHDLDLDVAAGEVVALLGANGAGKTTVLRALAGLMHPGEGELLVLGEPLPRRPHLLARQGVAAVLQRTRLFAELSVAENLRLAAGRCAPAAAAARFPAVEPLLHKRAGDLSGGEQQLAAIARAVARSPRLLLVDELSLGLATSAIETMMQTLVDISTQGGTAVVFAEQHAHHALAVADRAYVLAAGRVVLHGSGADLAADADRLTAAYLGGSSST